MPDAATRKFYILTCRCGHDFEVAPGQSGSTLNCPHCDTLHEIKCLRELEKFPSIERKIPTSHFRLQFRLLHLLILFVPCAITSLLIEQIGPEPVIICFSLVFEYLAAVLLAGLVAHNTGRILGYFWDRLQIRSSHHR